jgi:hypothetical protein
MNAGKDRNHTCGAALLVVLFIVMAITILSLGFLSRSDVELACGQNMILRTQIDYLAESGLEHARGMILNPQDVESEYWAGADAQQLVAGSTEYYDVEIMRDDSDPTDRCNYTIDCNAYWLEGGERIGRSELTAQLRLDPCVALWIGNDAAFWDSINVNGDVYCNGTLVNGGAIDGDVFANTLSGNHITGQLKSLTDLSLDWPRVTVADFTTNYATQTIGTGTVTGQIFGPYNPDRVCYRDGDLVLAGNVQITGMLVVRGNLTIQGSNNNITATKKLPALLVTGDLIVESSGGLNMSSLNISGLAVINGTVQVSAGAGGINVLGGLFIRTALVETTADSSGNGNTGTLYNNPTWQPSQGHPDGALEFNGDNTAVEIGINGMNPLQGTISLWAYAISFDGRAPLHHYLFGHTSTPTWWTDTIQLYTFEGGNSLFLGLGDTHHRHPDILNLNIQTWYHIALTWDGTNYIVYVNGTALASGGYTGLSTLGQVADIGNTGNPTYRIESWHGLIDDVRIYNRVLDANDVYPPRDGLPGLVGHWKLDETGSHIVVTAAPAKTAVEIWSETGDAQKWGQAAGAFYRSIERR